ncbi:DUF6799 domain-containing protein [Hymenobacter yonginensis]|uniref:DUF6799 domain-containing protein n=1 Tax=Hymenobacter yonginensis TaxID=748197 RepID=A0ABY7PL94_9BACT|nr:DUF6799 domain-containing protein [Hymenobacter yonginensis]WBO83787.1 hypothetical protein O9Z63_15565 [Hymenobacter yonginensis]
MKCFLPVLLGMLLALPEVGCAQTNDGFVRRDGTMYVLRNGQPRPMTHEVHLPNGRTVTPDGFVVAADGRRTELRNGSGCDLSGQLTAATTQANRVVLQPVAGTAGSSRNPVYVQRLPGWAKWAAGRGKGRHKKHKGKKHDD